MTNFTLDRSIFNKDLYTRLNTLWFREVPEGTAIAPVVALKKWYGVGTPEEKAALDAECTTLASPALQSISPEKLKLPAFISQQHEKEHAAELVEPFLDEVRATKEKDGADTLLALLILLDQMPRNIFRSQEKLPLVYNHYDRLALALIRSSMNLTPSPSENAAYAYRPVIKMWYYMPLMHSEDISAHELWKKKHDELGARLKEAGDNEAMKSMKGNYDAEEKHFEPLRRFGRYPHRNECLGRKNTAEEEEYMKTADTFGVKQSKKDEL